MRIGQTSVVSFASNLAASLIGFLATVYITQSLGSAVFGEYMVIISIVIWLQVVGVLGIEDAVTKRLSEVGETDRYLTAGLTLVLVIFAALSLAVLAAGGFVNGYVGEPVAVYIPLMLFAGLAFKFVAAALRGQHKVHVASLLKPVNRAIRSGLQIFFLAVGFGLVGLLVGYVIAGVSVAIVGIVFIATRPRLPRRRHFREIASFARYAWLGKLGSRTFASMDTLLLAAFVTSSFVGYYEAAWNLASMLAIFGVAIAQSMFPEISELASSEGKESVSGLITDSLAYTGLFLIPGLVGSVFVGDLVLRVYGNEFQQGYYVLLVLIVARLVYEYGNQFVNGLNAIDRPDLAFRVNAVFVATNVGLNVLLIATVGWIGAAVATAASAMVTTVLAFRAFTGLVSVEIPYMEIGRQWAAALAMGLVIFAGRAVFADRVLLGVALVGVGAVTYVVVLLGLSPRFRTIVERNLEFARRDRSS